MIYFLYAIFGLLPSFIWLLFYLRKDSHPEPNGTIVKVFLFGMLIGPIAILAELFIRWLLRPTGLTEFLASLQIGTKGLYLFANIVFAAPLVEEALKFGIVKTKVLKNPEFDEPLDAMLYMIIGALGFAAIENLLLVLRYPILPIGQVVTISALRFISATFVHALASGMLGYWLARSIKEPQKKWRFLAKGFGLAIFFHASYNALIWLVDTQKGQGLALQLMPLAMIFILIGLMAIAVSHSFSTLKRLHSVCNVCKIQREKLKAKKFTWRIPSSAAKTT